MTDIHIEDETFALETHEKRMMRSEKARVARQETRKILDKKLVKTISESEKLLKKHETLVKSKKKEKV